MMSSSGISYDTGDVINVTVATSETATAGLLCEMTDDYTGRDNETVSCTSIIGVWLKDGTAGEVCPVATSIVYNMLVGTDGVTAGKTVSVTDDAATDVEDDAVSGVIIGRSLETAANDAYADILIRP